MRNFAKLFVAVFLVAGAMALTSTTASAYWRHHGGWGPGFGFGVGIGAPYYYGGGPYYAYSGDNCGWARVRVWRGDHWGFRRAWRCW